MTLNDTCLAGTHDWTDWLWADHILNPDTNLWRRRCKRVGCKAMEQLNK